MADDGEDAPHRLASEMRHKSEAGAVVYTWENLLYIVLQVPLYG
jgi:hypothetical protein